MSNIDEKKKFILAHERKFAAQLGREVMQKPKLSSWMVMIPFIFLFYFQDLSKYKNGRREFTANFLLSREKALSEAEAALSEHRKHDTLSIARKADLPMKAQERYSEFLTALAEHYSSLLQADGESYEELLQSAYRQRKNYLTYIDQIGRAEKALNMALRPGLEKSVEGVADLVSSIEKNSEKLHRANAKEFFA